MTDTDMVLADIDLIKTDTDISVSAKNIGQQIYWSISSSNFWDNLHIFLQFLGGNMGSVGDKERHRNKGRRSAKRIEQLMI